MLAELSRLYNAGGASVIAALVLGSYLLYFLWCALRLWRMDVREHRLPHRILIPLAIATYTALPVSLLFAGRPADIWRVIGAVVLLPASAYPVFWGAGPRGCEACRHSGRRARVPVLGESGLGGADDVPCRWPGVFGSGSVHEGAR